MQVAYDKRGMGINVLMFKAAISKQTYTRWQKTNVTNSYSICIECKANNWKNRHANTEGKMNISLPRFRAPFSFFLVLAFSTNKR